MLTIERVSKNYASEYSVQKVVLNQVSLSLQSGELVSLIGSNGAGKSTLFKVISGETAPDSGSIFLGGQDITHAPFAVRSAWIATVFQNPAQGTATQLTVEENLAIASLKCQAKGLRTSLQFLRPALRKAQRQFFKDHLASLKMGLENRLNCSVSTLSGGERQGLALMMTVLTRPKLLLLDEPCAALDPKASQSVMKAALGLVRDQKLAVLMITHQMQHAEDYSDRILAIENGQIRSLEKVS